LFLKDEYPWFNAQYSANPRELMVDNADKTQTFFLNGIKRVFRECNKLLKNDGIFVFTFHHKETDAWAAILDPILSSGFFIEAVYPVWSETRGGLRVVGKEAISYDTIIVCKKRSMQTTETSWNTIRMKIYGETKDLVERLIKNRRFLSEADILLVAIGKGLEIYSRNYPNILFGDGKLDPYDAVHMIGDVIDSIIMELKDSELPSGLDDVSKIYMGYLLGGQTVEYDFLNKLSRSKNFDFHILENETVIEKEKRNKYKVLGPMKRGTLIQNKLRLNEDLLYIDKIHYLIRQYRMGKPIVQHLSKWKDETLSITLELYYGKTNDQDIKNIIDLLDKTMEIQKAPTLDSFGEGGKQ